MSDYGDKKKQGSSLEYWLEDSMAKIEFSDEQIAELAKILENLRPHIEEAMTLFDEEKDSWKHFRIAIWKAVPKAYEDRVWRTIEKWLRAGDVIDPSGRKSLV